MTFEKNSEDSRDIDTRLEIFFIKKIWKRLRTPLLVECDEQPVLLQEVEAASCRRRHETKHLLKTQYLWWQSHYILNCTNWPLPCPWQLWPCQPCDGRFVYENLSFPIPFWAKWYPNIRGKGSFFFMAVKKFGKFLKTGYEVGREKRRIIFHLY